MAQGPSAHVPLLFETTFLYQYVQPPRLPASECASKHTFSTWPFPHSLLWRENGRLPPPPVDTGVPYCLLMLGNDFNDFTFEHRSGCSATESGHAGAIGAIET